MKRVMAIVVMTSVCAGTFADTYYWRVTQPGTFRWEVTNGWTVIGDPANSNLWPRNPGDVANLFVPISQTQIYGHFQTWFTQNKYVGDIALSFSNDGSRHILFTAANSPLVVFLNPQKGYSKLIHTNVTPVVSGQANNQEVRFYHDTTFILSNDLQIANVCVENELGVTDYADMNFWDDTQIRGNGYKVIKTAPGWLTFDDNSKVLGAGELQINGSTLFVIDAAWGTTVIDCPIYVTSLYDCKNEYQRGTAILAGKRIDMDFVVRDGGYLATPYSGDGVTSWLQRELPGSIEVDERCFMYPYWVNDGRVWTNDLTGTVSGEGIFYTGFRNVRAGAVRFLGRIQPGGNGIGELYVNTFTNYFVAFGTKDGPVSLEIDVDGLRDWIGEDADFLGYAQGSLVKPMKLGDINLTVKVGKASNPYRTNEILWSREQQLNGDFNSVTWVGGRTGEVIVTPESVYVTGIPPATTNFFDVLPDRLIMVQGQTQDVVRLRSPFAVLVNVSNNAGWVTVASQVMVTGGGPAEVSVTVPANQPATNSWGLSRGDLWFQAAAEPEVSYNVPVFVLRPGYFELNARWVYFFANEADYVTLRAYSPFNVNINVTPINSPWITVTPSTLNVNDSYAYTSIQISAQPAGTTGTVRFTNMDLPSVQHDVVVFVVRNGFFDTVEKELVFVQGETQKWFEVYSPFRAEVDIEATNYPWISVPEHVSIDGESWLVPVTIPANQAVDSTGIISLRNSCFPDITNSVRVTVVPEGSVAWVGVIVLTCLIRRR
ncbi:MAG: hypothetical protein N2595_02760 [bacterium]|nr:hypothetical protein [bacterium]